MVGHEQDGLRHFAEVRGAHRVHGDLRNGLSKVARTCSDKVRFWILIPYGFFLDNYNSHGVSAVTLRLTD
jgi:hypothetical protein